MIARCCIKQECDRLHENAKIEVDLPIGFLPNMCRLVDELCGGGFSICDAVGARDWRIEYVRCILRMRRR